jgi:hypothetical protein
MGIPVLEVTSPLAGTTYHIGDTIPITWNNCETYQGNVTISLVGQGTNGLSVASNVPIANSGYQFVVPGGYNPPLNSLVSTWSLGGQYTIWISDGRSSDSSIDQGSSGIFTILPSVIPQPTQSNWIYSATAPQGFDTSNNGIVGSAPYYVIFKQDSQTIHLVWTKNGTPAADSNGNMFYGTSLGITQLGIQQSVTANFQQQVASYFTSSQKNYLVARLFIDGGPQYQSWSITNY